VAHPLRLESFVWAIGALCNLNRTPFDAKLLLHRFPPPYDVNQLHLALQSYGFKTALQNTPIQELHPTSFPVLAILKPLATDATGTDNIAVSSQQSAVSSQQSAVSPI